LAQYLTDAQLSLACFPTASLLVHYLKSRALIVQSAGDFFDLITFDNITGF